MGSSIIIRFYSLLLTIIIFSHCFCNGNSDVLCIERERQALLQFKQGLKDPSNRLSSWAVGEEDCCKWAGVICHNLTGNVHEIHLPNPFSDVITNSLSVAKYEAFLSSNLGGKISPSLLNLKQLSHLDLSYNDFGGIPIPHFIGSLQSLRYLNLSRAGFGGMIPYQLGNLSMLHSLSLGGYPLSVENLQWLSGLPLLQYLEMSWVNISKTNEWVQVINRLPCLVELHLRGCKLNRIPRLATNINFTSLAILDLSYNSFDSSIPEWLFTLTSLVSLDIRLCSFHGPIPSSLRNMTYLRDLDISSNYFNSTIPSWWFSFRHLENLNLGGNNFEGAIPSAIGDMASLTRLDLSYSQLKGRIPTSLGNLCNLREIDLSGNIFTNTNVSDVLQIFSRGCVLHGLESLKFEGSQLFGRLDDRISQFKNLKTLYLYENSLSGPIPDSIGRLSSLQFLDLSYNKLNGTLPESFGQLVKLESLDISGNLLNGNVSEVHFRNLKKLRVLYAGENMLTLKPSGNWVPPFQLEDIYISSWQLGPQFPLWLQSQRNLYSLDISNTGILDNIPTWFWNISSQLLFLDVSQNQMHGEVPNLLNFDAPYSLINLGSNYFNGPLPIISTNIFFLNLSNNYFSGSLNHFLCQKMNKSNNLEALHFGHNLLLGKIPNCWMNWQSLGVINLENNNLAGEIPESMGYLRLMRSLHLRNNNLFGKLPPSLQNCRELALVDFAENEFIGSIPSWIGKQLLKLKLLILRSNKFQGNIPNALCGLASLQILDLAQNNLWGTIPRCFKNFSAMAIAPNNSRDLYYSLNHSGIQDNALLVTKGREFEYSNILGLVTNMDLSKNNLTGNIPSELMTLLGLRWLNLSKNHFTGRIPEKIGDMILLESLDLSTNQLSGEIPSSMSSMTFLSHLNLSNNNLTGKIPSSPQLQGFNESSFTGNSLCGPPLIKKCNEIIITPSGGNEGEEGEGFKVDWFFLSMLFGFVVGFWAVLGPLVFNMSWRVAYFQFLDRMGYKLCDVIYKYC